MTPARVLGPQDGKMGELGPIGVRFMIGGADSSGRYALVEYLMPPRQLGAPLHRHSREDEYSYVLEGRMGALLGDEVTDAGPGDLVFKPRNQWHTFWNAGDEPARILEMISPAGFEGYFDELVDLRSDAGPATVPVLAERYGLELDLASIPWLLERFDLSFGPAEPSEGRPQDSEALR